MGYDSKDVSVVNSNDLTTGQVESHTSSYSSAPRNKLEWLIRKLEVEPRRGRTLKQMFLLNPDLKPVEQSRRLWSWYNYVFFWISDSLNINSWQIASTGVTAGLTWWQAWISVWLGYSIAGGFVVMMARTGAYSHTSFPVGCRASFGVFGSTWPVINRVVMAIIWFAVQTWIFGQCVQVILRAIFRNNLDETMGSQYLSGTTTFQFLSFFLAWLFQLPAIWFPPHTIRHLFTAKSIIAPIAGIGFLVWTIVKADGLGQVIHKKSALDSHDLGWAFVSSTMNCIANFAALIINAPDFSRFATKPSSPMLSQLLTIPAGFAVTTLIGILCSAASEKLYGEAYWSPLDLLGRFLDHYHSSSRAGVVFIAAGFGLAQIGTNIAANSLSAGTDMTALLPQFINIRRGGYICAILALCICPWNFFSSSNQFTTYLSAYSVFLSSIAGVIAADYYWIRRGAVNLLDLYSGKKGSTYMYTLGCNWRAYAAYLLGLVPNMPGFVGACGHDVPKGAIYLYTLNYFVGFLVSFFLYCIFCYFFPVQGVPEPIAKNPWQKGWYEENKDVEDFDDQVLLHTSSKY